MPCVYLFVAHVIMHFIYLPCMNMSTHMLKQMHAARVGVT